MKKTAHVLSSLLLLLFLPAIAFAGGQGEAATPMATGGGAAAHESPMLTEMVEAGELPPLADRLPTNPAVLHVESIGTYGGTLTRAWKGPGDAWGIEKLAYNNLFRFDSFTTKVIPDIAESYDMGPDGKTLTVYLREGAKWSDGEPFTADDILFAYYDVQINDEISPVPSGLAAALTSVTKVNDYEVTFVSDEPVMAALLLWMTRFFAPYVAYPRHYLEQFHAAYRDRDELVAEAKDEGYSTWVEYFQSKATVPRYRNAESPVMGPWMPAPGSNSDSQVYTLVRNPYYHAVDSEGNQLPYIDRVNNITVADREIMLLQISQGNITIQARNMSLNDIQVLKAGEASGGYTTVVAPTAQGAASYMQMNMTSKDPFKRQFFQDLRVRQALSLAANREEMNEINYFGQGVARQVSYIPQSPAYIPEWEDYFAEYDPARARSLIDEFIADVGASRDSQGFLVDPNTGDRFVFYLDAFEGYSASTLADLELLQKYYAAIGVQAELRIVDRTLYEERGANNDNDTAFWTFTQALRPDQDPKNIDNTQDWPAWWDWFDSNGEVGEEPTNEDALRIMELVTELDMVFEEDARIEVAKQIGRLSMENLFILGFVGMTPVPIPVDNDLRNVPEGMIYAEELSDIGGMMPYQFYFESN